MLMKLIVIIGMLLFLKGNNLVSDGNRFCWWDTLWMMGINRTSFNFAGIKPHYIHYLCNGFNTVDGL